MFISSDVSELGFGFPSASSLLFASLQALGANARFGQGLEACSAASKSSVGDPQLRGKKWQTVFKGTSRNPETVNPRVDLYPESTGNPPRPPPQAKRTNLLPTRKPSEPSQPEASHHTVQARSSSSKLLFASDSNREGLGSRDTRTSPSNFKLLLQGFRHLQVFWGACKG